MLARELDPLSLFVNVGVAWVHHFAGRPEEAVREALKAREIVPGFEEAGNVLIASYEALGRYEEAAAVDRPAAVLGPARSTAQALRDAFRAGGRAAHTGGSGSRCWTLAAPSAPPVDPLRLRGRPPASRGRSTQALDHVERMVERPHRRRACSSASIPFLASLRGDPRYEALLKRVGVPRRERLQHRIQRRHDRHRHAGRGGAAHDRALQRFDLDPLPLRQIDQQRRPHRRRECAST